MSSIKLFSSPPVLLVYRPGYKTNVPDLVIPIIFYAIYLQPPWISVLVGLVVVLVCPAVQAVLEHHKLAVLFVRGAGSYIPVYISIV